MTAVTFLFWQLKYRLLVYSLLLFGWHFYCYNYWHFIGKYEKTNVSPILCSHCFKFKWSACIFVIIFLIFGWNLVMLSFISFLPSCTHYFIINTIILLDFQVHFYSFFLYHSAMFYFSLSFSIILHVVINSNLEIHRDDWLFLTVRIEWKRKIKISFEYCTFIVIIKFYFSFV